MTSFALQEEHLHIQARVRRGAREKVARRAPFAAMAKCFASDVAMKVATDAVHLFGAAGVSEAINRSMRDAKVLQMVEGTNQIQRNLIANALLGRAPG